MNLPTKSLSENSVITGALYSSPLDYSVAVELLDPFSATSSLTGSVETCGCRPRNSCCLMQLVPISYVSGAVGPFFATF